MEDTKNKDLQKAHDYWYKEWGKMGKQIDTLCVSSAERLNKVRYTILKNWDGLDQPSRSRLVQERASLENILQHFHGELDEEYIRGHNLGPVYWEE
jgi:hypothetical protein